MTREQYDRKTADGTLTVRDVLEHREYATAEQLAAVSPSGLRIDRGPGDRLAQSARQVRELSRRLDELDTEVAVATWQDLNGGQEPTPAEGRG